MRQYDRELQEVREALLQRASTETPADLPWLKAQAVELERLIRIAPPSALIAKFQYEEQLTVVRNTILYDEQDEHPLPRSASAHSVASHVKNGEISFAVVARERSDAGKIDH